MVNLEKTRWHVYYLFDYVKPKLYDKYDDKSINRSKEIWKFKNFDVDANEYFKNEIINGTETFPVIKNAGIASSSITLKEDEYFVLGDNRNNSKDSRFFGSVEKSQIIGKVKIKKWKWGR